ncbi:uncharacterized protein LOC111593663 [Drosophila hydei]|uniref:Uncharacterized protein LOC111593663 n=1 Tax=Drosophila hydei TaxID=7224 RepID=A0A6J1LAY8_DROHY|nr:uncharacterized protein LOC111593663 [Drosophila hydei]
MPSDLTSLMARRNVRSTITGPKNSALHSLLAPIHQEVHAAHAHAIIMRQRRIRELFEREMEQVKMELNRLRPTQVGNNCRFRSTPLGMVSVAVRYINQIPLRAAGNTFPGNS